MDKLYEYIILHVFAWSPMTKLNLWCMIVPPLGSHGRPRGFAPWPPMTACGRHNHTHSGTVQSQETAQRHVEYVIHILNRYELMNCRKHPDCFISILLRFRCGGKIYKESKVYDIGDSRSFIFFRLNILIVRQMAIMLTNVKVTLGKILFLHRLESKLAELEQNPNCRYIFF